MSLDEIMPKVPVLPDQTIGHWRRETFEITESEARLANIRLGSRGVKPGTYTRLRDLRVPDNMGVMMSDTHAERDDHAAFALVCSGRVLITGLGLGMVAYALARREDIEHLTIVESEQDVIDLTAPALLAAHGDKITIVHHDAYSWRGWEPRTYDWAWHDVWIAMGADYCAEYGRMRRNYVRAMREPRRQMCWGEEISRRQQRQERAWRM